MKRKHWGFLIIAVVYFTGTYDQEWIPLWHYLVIVAAGVGVGFLVEEYHKAGR